jgi:hypothetical protein
MGHLKGPLACVLLVLPRCVAPFVPDESVRLEATPKVWKPNHALILYHCHVLELLIVLGVLSGC